MKAFIDWLYATPLSQTLQTVKWIIPAVQSVHILSLSVLFTAMMMLDLRLLRVAGTQHSVEYYSNRFLPWLWGALPILLVTGLLMIAAEPNRDLQNVAFWLKMGMLSVACLLMYGFQRELKHDPSAWEPRGARGRIGLVLGAACLLLWAGIVVSGRLIAYV